jgi:two-component system chemotaxis family response regulator WspR
MPEPVAPPRRLRISLQAKLLVLVLFCVAVPLLGLGGYLVKRNRETLRDKVHEALTNQLFRKSTELQDWADQRLREASSWSSSFVVFEGVETLSRPGADHDRAHRDVVDYLLSVLGHYRVYESLFVVDLNGEALAGTREERLEDWGVAMLSGGAVDKGRLSPVRRSEYLGRATQLVLQPIQGRSNRTVGFFVGRLDLRELESHLNTPVDAETAFLLPRLDVKEIESRLVTSSELTPSFWILDESGRVLAEAGKLLARPGTAPFPVALPEESPSVIPVKEANLPGLGATVYGVRRLEPPLQGHIAATVASVAAYRSLRESGNRLLLFGGSAILGIFILTFVAARQILRPIMLLVDGAKKVSAGESVDIPVRGADEIADLTIAFNEMARTVREGRRSLEEARDELAHSNEGLKEANRALEALAITDGLTGLYNHRHFQDTLEKEMRRCERESRNLSLLLLDLDHFKQYNDRWGHTEGDAALRRVAGQVMKSIRSTDMAFRYGGEELAVLLPSCTKEQATEVAEKIRVAVATNPQRPGRFGARTTISIGVATFPDDGRVARGLVDTADAALYAAKAQGRDRVVQAGTHGPTRIDRSETVG